MPDSKAWRTLSWLVGDSWPKRSQSLISQSPRRTITSITKPCSYITEPQLRHLALLTPGTSSTERGALQLGHTPFKSRTSFIHSHGYPIVNIFRYTRRTIQSRGLSVGYGWSPQSCRETVNMRPIKSGELTPLLTLWLGDGKIKRRKRYKLIISTK